LQLEKTALIFHVHGFNFEPVSLTYRVVDTYINLDNSQRTNLRPSIFNIRGKYIRVTETFL
jgi:hypothetical protein